MKIVVANSKGGSGKSTLVLALADILPSVQVIDLDTQGTITIGASYTKRHSPVSEEEATDKYWPSPIGWSIFRESKLLICFGFSQ